MKYILRSVEEGKRISLDMMEEKKKAVKEKILTAGFDYIEYSAILGSYNEIAERIEEQVIIIEATTETNYV